MNDQSVSESARTSVRQPPAPAVVQLASLPPSLSVSRLVSRDTVDVRGRGLAGQHRSTRFDSSEEAEQ